MKAKKKFRRAHKRKEMAEKSLLAKTHKTRGNKNERARASERESQRNYVSISQNVYVSDR